jgi:ligand-binding sensor domain-containing protein
MTVFKYYTTENGLGDNQINGILEDDDNNLWISTEEGISKLIHGRRYLVIIAKKMDFRAKDLIKGLIIKIKMGSYSSVG